MSTRPPANNSHRPDLAKPRPPQNPVPTHGLPGRRVCAAGATRSQREFAPMRRSRPRRVTRCRQRFELRGWPDQHRRSGYRPKSVVLGDHSPSRQQTQASVRTLPLRRWSAPLRRRRSCGKRQQQCPAVHVVPSAACRKSCGGTLLLVAVGSCRGLDGSQIRQTDGAGVVETRRKELACLRREAGELLVGERAFSEAFWILSRRSATLTSERDAQLAKHVELQGAPELGRRHRIGTMSPIAQRCRPTSTP